MYSPEEFDSAPCCASNHVARGTTTGDPSHDRHRNCAAYGSITGSRVQYLSTVLVLAAALALSACAPGMPLKSGPGTPAATEPVQALQHNTASVGGLDTGKILQWYEEARDIVARDQRVDLSNLTAEVADERTIAIHARTSLLGALSHDLTNADFAESLVDNILKAQTASVLAIYSPDQRKILMHRDNLIDYLRTSRESTTRSDQTEREDKASIQALLIHELIHASDHVRHNAFNSNKNTSYQEVFAKSTIIEGHAQWHTRRLCKLSGCSGAFDTLNQYMFEVDTPSDPALEYVQNRNFKSLEFVYKEGERFIDALMKRPNGQRLVATAFASPPRDSIQIIDPASFPNRQREVRNLILSNAIESSQKPWSKRRKGTLKRNVLAAAAFSVNPEARRPIVDFYTTKVLATAKHEYYDRDSDTPIPIAIIALQTDTINTATNTAELVFDSTSQTYSDLNGTLVTLSNWTTSQHTANIDRDNKHPLRIDMYTASGNMNNGMINAAYPIKVVTATAGNYIVHIDGRYSGSKTDLMQLAGQLLTTLAK